MRRALGMTIVLAATALAAASSSAGEHQKVPAAIVKDLNVPGLGLEFDASGNVTNLAAEPIELNGDSEPELEVHGLGHICGAANCVTWLYRKAGRGYERLLDAGTINRIEPQKSFTQGYRDIMAVMHGSAYESDLKLYKFDGHVYRRKGCFSRTSQIRDKDGAMRDLKEPRITRVKCGNEPS